MQFDTRSLWIYIHFSQLQLDSMARNQASEKDQAVAIVDVASNQLCQVNTVARAQAVKVGMGLASASLLCSELHLQEYSHELESKQIENIANHLYLLTSDIVLAPPNALILRAQNMLKLYQGLEGYWQIIQHSLQEQSVNFVAASAYSVQAAKMIALSLSRSQQSQIVKAERTRSFTGSQSKRDSAVSTISTNNNTPNNYTANIRPSSKQRHLITESREQISKYLSRCMLEVSDIDHKDLHKLARIGIKSYADLCSLPAAELANRVSRFSMSIINELKGKDAAKVKFYQPKASYHDYIELLYEISLSDKLLPVIGRCLDKLSQFLLIRNAHSLSVEIGFFQREHSTLTLPFNSIRPIYKSQDWLDIISLKLESLRFESPVYALSLRCLQYEVAQVSNDDMFTQKSTHVAAMTLLSRLQSKLGQDNVRRLQFVDDFRPELSTQHGSLLSEHRPNKNATAASIFSDRPGLLLPSPQPLSLDVQVIKGPERIQTGWWDDQSINRDYYIGQSQDGQQVWIFKTPNQEWYLHGYFI